MKRLLPICSLLAACEAPSVTDKGGLAHTGAADTGAAETSPPDTGVPVELVPGDTAADAAPSDAVFDLETIHDITLTLDSAAWADISDNPWAETWHTADFTWDDETVATVGVRAFGYSSHVAGKPPLKIDFNREVEGQRWRDLEALKLRNSYYDASFMHDALEAWMLRAAGVPASRTGWARVWANGACPSATA